MAIKDWEISERPREKLLEKGVASLTHIELISILIGSGTQDKSAMQLSEELLKKFNLDVTQLSTLAPEEMQIIKGIGMAKSVSIVAAIELGKRAGVDTQIHAKKITSSQMAFELVGPFLSDLKHEEFWVIFLDNAKKVLRRKKFFSGGISSSVVDTRMIFKEAILLQATGIIIFHNHPSYQLKPSENDIQVTRKIKEGGVLLDIKLLDHLIVCSKEYYSFSDMGML